MWRIFRDGFQQGLLFFWQPLVGAGRVGEFRARSGFLLFCIGFSLILLRLVGDDTWDTRAGLSIELSGILLFASGCIARRRDLKRRGIFHDRSLWD